MKDSTPNTPTAATTITTTTTSPSSPTTNKDKSTANATFRDTRAELAQLLKKKEEIEVCEDDFSSSNHIFFLEIFIGY